jgi:general stress protein YciG
VKATRGPNFYEEIGRKGGQKVKKLIEEGKRAARALQEAQAGAAAAAAAPAAAEEERAPVAAEEATPERTE